MFQVTLSAASRWRGSLSSASLQLWLLGVVGEAAVAAAATCRVPLEAAAAAAAVAAGGEAKATLRLSLGVVDASTGAAVASALLAAAAASCTGFGSLTGAGAGAAAALAGRCGSGGGGACTRKLAAGTEATETVELANMLPLPRGRRGAAGRLEAPKKVKRLVLPAAAACLPRLELAILAAQLDTRKCATLLHQGHPSPPSLKQY